MTAPGRIVVLNGPPRSGKSSIVAALQQTGPWINLGVDVYNRGMPAQLLPGIGLRPGGERPDIENKLPALYAALYESLAAHSRQGLDVVADLGHHDFYSAPLNLLPACARRLSGLPAFFVGVTAPIETILERRRADAKDGFYAVDEEIVRRWQEAVHTPGIYDLTLDTAAMTPQACAAAVLAALSAMPSPSAFERLAGLRTERWAPEAPFTLAEADPALIGEIEGELLASIRASQPQALNSSFTLSMRDDDGTLVAGLAASTAYGWLLVKLLWVAESRRGRGLGRRLMAEAEAEGLRRGCHGAWLDTSMPDAAGFYERLGYETFGLLENAPGDAVPGHRRWFMRKRLG